MMNMLRALMVKVGKMQEQMNNVSKEMENLQNNQTEMLKIKKTNRNEGCL